MGKKTEKILLGDRVITQSLDEYFTQEKQVQEFTMEQLRAFSISPAYYGGYMENKDLKMNDKREHMLSEALAFYFHHGSHDFSQKYVALMNKDLPEITATGKRNYTLKANKDYRDYVFPKKAVGKIVLSEYEYELIENIGKANYENPFIKKVFTLGEDNNSALTTDVKTGMNLCARLGYLSASCPKALFDFQIVKNASPLTIGKALFYGGGHNRAVFSLDSAKREEYVIFAFENVAPFVCQRFVLTREVIDKARYQNRMLLDLLYFCRTTGDFMGYSDFALAKQYWEGVVDMNYIGGPCTYFDKHETNLRLYQLYENENTGQHLIELPKWVK